jgi:antitoxin component YwqK of YwqJK toxin-antitoxin module
MLAIFFHPIVFCQQQYMIVKNDTIPFKKEIVKIKKNDTIYKIPYPNFIMENKEIRNFTNENNSKDGFWIESNPKIVWKGNYHQNNKVGDWVGTPTDTTRGEVVEHYNGNGKIIHKHIYNKQGNVVLKEVYRHETDFIFSDYLAFHDNGKTSQEVYFKTPVHEPYLKNGRPNKIRYNIAKVWDENGTLEREINFNNPNKELEMIYYSDGQLSRRNEYIKLKNNKKVKDGICYIYYKNERIVSKEHFKKGKLKKVEQESY